MLQRLKDSHRSKQRRRTRQKLLQFVHGSQENHNLGERNLKQHHCGFNNHWSWLSEFEGVFVSFCFLFCFVLSFVFLLQLLSSESGYGVVIEEELLQGYATHVYGNVYVAHEELENHHNLGRRLGHHHPVWGCGRDVCMLQYVGNNLSKFTSTRIDAHQSCPGSRFPGHF